jgi:site-specific DNA-methyltransferase (adenine-specific)
MLQARVLVGDAVERLQELPDGSVRTCVTSPPYWGLRDYGNDGQLGLEPTPQEFVENLCKVFDEVWRVLADDGTLWVNLGDSYANKSLAGIPWRFAFSMQDRGWYLRQDIIWAKPNPMPESVTDRCTKSHEYVFLLTKNPRYYFDNEAIKEPVSHPNLIGKTQKVSYHDDSAMRNDGNRVVVRGDRRNKRSVWTVTTKPYKEAHFAVYPPELITPCILSGSAEGDTVLDPFSGSGTTGEVALTHGRNYFGIELNPEYAALSEKRLTNAIGMLGEVRVD